MFVIAAFFVPGWGALLIIAGLSCLAQIEFYGMVRAAGIPVFRITGLLGGVALITATFFTVGPEYTNMAKAYKWQHLVFLSFLIATLVMQFPQKDNSKAIETIACTLLGFLYVPYLMNFFTLLGFQWDGSLLSNGLSSTGCRLILYAVLVVKITDIGAYFTGRLIGKHKLFPRLSPAKTWEGAVGGVIVAVLASLLFAWITKGDFGKFHIGFMDAAILGVLLSIAGIVGDLFESLVKRASGIKDSGKMIPGMGGLLDVLDSLLFAVPALYVYVRVKLL